MITRCKDCIHAYRGITGELRCENYGSWDTDAVVNEDNFCAYGRKTFAEGYDNAAILEEMEKESEEKDERHGKAEEGLHRIT